MTTMRKTFFAVLHFSKSNAINPILPIIFNKYALLSNEPMDSLHILTTSIPNAGIGLVSLSHVITASPNHSAISFFQFPTRLNPAISPDEIDLQLPEVRSFSGISYRFNRANVIE